VSQSLLYETTVSHKGGAGEGGDIDDEGAKK
jgi:hypothetical protein